MSKSLTGTLHSCTAALTLLLSLPVPFASRYISPSPSSTHYLSDSDRSSFPLQSTSEVDRTRQLHLSMFIQLIFHTLTSNIVALYCWGNRSVLANKTMVIWGHLIIPIELLMLSDDSTAKQWHPPTWEQDGTKWGPSMTMIIDECKYTICAFSPDGFIQSP